MASLTAKSGLLGRRLAAHLLRRATYQVSPSRIDEFALKTAEQAVEELFVPTDLQYPDGPRFWVNGELVFDPTDVLGGTHYHPDFTNSYKLYFTHAWRMYEAMADTSAKWKVTNWLSSLFVVYSHSYFIYFYWRLLEKMAFQDLKTLGYKATLDHNMLYFLSGVYNSKNGPNENYAREFLELFTILKGPINGVENYTNYTEQDIRVSAKLFTGFYYNYTNVDPDTGFVTGYARYDLHDTSPKTFSGAFNDQTIAGAVDANDMYRELHDYVDLVYDQIATARSFVTRMYRYFVSDVVDTEVESDIIEPLANDLMTNGYQHIPVLKKLLKSVHFYDEDDSDSTNEVIGGKIKSPYELMWTTKNLLDIPEQDNSDLYKFWYTDYHAMNSHHMRVMDLELNGPITVEGFPGFYKEPGYSKNWFNVNLIYNRFSVGTSFKRGRVRETSTAFPYMVDLVAWVNNNIEDPAGPGTPPAPIGAANATKVVTDFLEFLVPEMPTGERYNYFENALLGDLSPINWYFSWLEYQNTGDDTNVRVAIENLYDAILASPEFQTF